MKPRKRDKQPHFEISTFLVSEDQLKYLQNALLKQSQSKGINPLSMNIEQLQTITLSLKFNIKPKLMHQLFLFATYCKQGNGGDKKKMIALVNKTKIAINLGDVAKWLINKLEKQKISLGEFHNPRSFSHNLKNCPDKNQKFLLPSLVGKPPGQRFQSQVSKVLQIFQKMQKQRQNMGLVPIPIDTDDEIDPQRQPIESIPYDADFHDVNKNLFKLKTQAEARINEIIMAAKEDKKLKWRLERSMQKYQRIRTEANEKIGRGGSMKAQKRMIDRTKRQVQALQEWRRKQNYSQMI